jgi:hypothetical protein
LWKVLSKAMAKNAEDRFLTGTELAMALQAVLNGATDIPQPGVAALAAAAGPAPAAAAEAAASPAVPAPAKKPMSIGMLIGLAVVCMIVGIVGTLLFMTMRK